VYYRHRLPVRLMHWINALSLVILFMSGLQIFNAHPRLYWGSDSYGRAAPFFEIGAQRGGDGALIGTTRFLGWRFETTGVLGVSASPQGMPWPRAFPAALTIPGPYSLALARQWHFFFAWVFVGNGLLYLLYSLWSGHLARDLWPTRPELRAIGASIADHLRLRHAHGAAARHYNVLQKLAYLIVILALLPGMALMGWAMSPWLDAVLPGWVDWVGGRQSARALHFIGAWLLALFLAVHVFQVLVSGVWNQLRSMVTGYCRIAPEAAAPAAKSGPAAGGGAGHADR
jgi:thiosulfate reductase cytochrome b subunit